MSSELGRVEDLPKDYYDGLVAKNTLPLVTPESEGQAAKWLADNPGRTVPH